MSSEEEKSETVISLERVSVTYSSAKSDILAISDVQFCIQRNEFVTILGPSGSGKSTILHLIAGFIEPSSGKVHVQRSNRDDLPPRGAFVFQEFVLYPWLTVAQNIGFGLRIRGVPHVETRKIVDEYVYLVGLSSFSDVYPNSLSGGMKQRVGLARALASEAEILLMDEPFGSLDAQTRFEMQELLLKIIAKYSKTIAFVTHDISEAIFLSDRAIVLSGRPGTVTHAVPIGLPRPRTREMIGSTEFEKARKCLMDLVY